MCLAFCLCKYKKSRPVLLVGTLRRVWFVLDTSQYMPLAHFVLPCRSQRRFWEEYQRESSPRPGGLESIAGGVNSLYLILPLLLVVLLIAAVSITIWRCHSRKRSQQSPAIGRPQRDTTLSVVSMDQWGRDFHPDVSPHSEISAHSSPAYPGVDLTPGRGGRGDPPPSYEEAVGHTDVHIEAEPPPQYEDIISNHGATVIIAQGK